MNTILPLNITDAVLKKSNLSPLKDAAIVKGYNFNEGVNFDKIFASYKTTGFQATNFSLAVEEITKMLDLKCKPLISPSEINLDPCNRKDTNCKIFLGFTSNIISSGVRESITYLAEHNMVDCIVTTAGGVEEDLIKCLGSTYIGDFYAFQGAQLRDQGINRIGNLLVPNDNYCKFEDWVMPIFDAMLIEQKESGIVWTPSKMIMRLGKEINDPTSFCYWSYKNNIPVYSPALTDGSLGDMLYMHSYRNPGLILDIIQDLRQINNQAVYAKSTGIIILGGGLIKHHICNANLMRNGADFSVFVNTSCDFDGSDSGARPDEAISWGKIKKDAHPVKVYGEVSLIFPLIVAETFAKFQSRFDYKNEAQLASDQNRGEGDNCVFSRC